MSRLKNVNKENSKNMNLRLNFVTQYDRNTGSTRIRIYNILSNLKKYFRDVTINLGYQNTDIVIFQKHVNLKLLHKYRQKGVYTCFDTDDLFEHFEDMIKYVDLVITSVEYLKDELLKINPNVIIVQNSLDIENLDILPKNSMPNISNPKIGWFGWSTNAYILDEIGIGNDVQVISDKSEPPYNVDTIDDELKNFDYIVIPQKVTPHTLSKTNCRFLKALYLGIPCFVSNMPEYMKLASEIDYPKEYIVENLEDFKSIITSLKNGTFNAPNLDFNKIRAYIKENYSSEFSAQSLAEQLYDKYTHRNIKEEKEKTKSMHIKNDVNILKFIIENIFSLKNRIYPDGVYKVLCILGIKIKIKKK